jgi:hypothetical protein
MRAVAFTAAVGEVAEVTSTSQNRRDLPLSDVHRAPLRDTYTEHSQGGVDIAVP